MLNIISAIMTLWHEGKVRIEQSVPISHGVLHVLAGAVIWLVAAGVLRRRRASWRPWLAVCAIILWNEAVDLSVEQWPDFAEQLWEGAKDVMWTMLVPTLLLLSAHATHGKLEGKQQSREPDDQRRGDGNV